MPVVVRDGADLYWEKIGAGPALILGAGLTEIKDREEYLKKQSEAQYEVEQSRLVEAVREVLARHDVSWG